MRTLKENASDDDNDDDEDPTSGYTFIDTRYQVMMIIGNVKMMIREVLTRVIVAVHWILRKFIVANCQGHLSFSRSSTCYYAPITGVHL